MNPAAAGDSSLNPDDVIVIVKLSSGFSGPGVGVGDGPGVVEVVVVLGEGAEEPPVQAAVDRSAASSNAHTHRHAARAPCRLPVPQALSGTVTDAGSIGVKPSSLTRYRKKLSTAVVGLLLACAPSGAAGQEPSGWQWRGDANVFLVYNHQDRRFVDFTAWESQNWFMLAGDGPVGRGRVSVTGMISLEPFTLDALGSPQAFQTGESYHGSALIDYQHPHDLLMNLGASYRVERGAWSYVVGADLVGTAALGPPPFMHRDSARDNPQTPLGHHQLDATHATPGVVRGGIGYREWQAEASWFRGREPDDKRIAIDRPWLDSWSARIGWRRGSWQAQVSGGHLTRPEAVDPFDETRLTASIGFNGRIGSRATAVTAAWGQNREVHGDLNALLLEWNTAPWRSGSVYGRGEIAQKDLLGATVPRDREHQHIPSRIGALTLGYLHDLIERRWGRIGVGGDATLYRTSADLRALYGGPRAFHLFLRYRPAADASMGHVH